ncbi:MAG: flippase-like domain-containing protein [Kofleriaceae bacterium]|nr:flippase-like domain-containing protein [Kofleriaceae bacterium]
MLERATSLRRRTVLGALVAIAFLVATTALTVAYFTDLKTLVRVLSGGSWPWIAAAVAVHLVYFFGYAILYRLGFAVVGISLPARSIVPVLFAGLFINLMVPTGAGAAALFVNDAVRRGHSGAHATVGVVLVLLLDLLTVVPFVIWGIAFLLHARMFESWQLLAAGAYVLYLVLLVAMIALSRIKQSAVRRALGWLSRMLHRVLGWFHRRGPADDWPERTAAGLADAAGAIVANPSRLALAALSGLAIHALHALGLWLFVVAFGAQVPVGGLVAAFSLGIVLQVIAVVPQLAPLSQAFMTATFVDVGVEAGPAVAATFAFRGILLAVPVVIGLPFAWRIGRVRVDARRRSREQDPRA